MLRFGCLYSRTAEKGSSRKLRRQEDIKKGRELTYPTLFLRHCLCHLLLLAHCPTATGYAIHPIAISLIAGLSTVAPLGVVLFPLWPRKSRRYGGCHKHRHKCRYRKNQKKAPHIDATSLPWGRRRSLIPSASGRTRTLPRVG